MKHIHHTMSQALIIYATLFSTNVSSLDLTSSARIGTAYTNNSLRSFDDKKNDVVTTLGVSLSLQENSKTIKTNINYDLQKTYYDNKTQDKKTTAEGIGKLNWFSSSKLFEWQVLNSTRNLQINRRDNNIEDNKDQRNIFSTGPALNIRLSKVDLLSLSNNYQSTSFEKSNIESKGNSQKINLIHKLSNTSSISMGFNYITNEFTNNTQPDLKKRATYATYTTQSRNTSTKLKGGYSEVKFNKNDSSGGLTIEGLFTFNVSDHHISIFGLNEHTDSISGLQNTSASIDAGISIDDTNFDIIDIIERNYVNFSYTNSQSLKQCYSCNRVSLTYIFDNQNYEKQPRDETTHKISLLGGYKLSSRRYIEASYSIDKTEFKEGALDSVIEHRLKFEVEYSPLSNTNLSLYTNYIKRITDTSEAKASEWVFGVTINYKLR